MANPRETILVPLAGFRDLGPEVLIPRQAILQTIEGVYRRYGFGPLDTPDLERHEVLTGKYGEEAERLIYHFKDHGGRHVAMRYDLTVPLARYMAANPNTPLPYRRYQIGKVHRADSPQKARYREFQQFDADQVGIKSTAADAEIIAMMADSMRAVGLPAEIRVNNRLFFDALTQRAGLTDKEAMAKLVGTIDKIDKIGADEVIAETQKEFGAEVAGLVKEFVSIDGDVEDRLKRLAALFPGSETCQEGIDNIQNVFKLLRTSGYTNTEVIFDQKIARGLNYYTGIIFETVARDAPHLGSVCSGGRYDRMIKDMGGPDLPAVGTSIGVDRLFDVLEQVGLLPKTKTTAELYLAHFEGIEDALFSLATGLRQVGINVEQGMLNKKLGQQMQAAQEKGIKYAVIAGPTEIANLAVKVRSLADRSEDTVAMIDLAKYILALLGR